MKIHNTPAICNNEGSKCIMLQKYESTNFLVREYTNCMCFVHPLDVKVLVPKINYYSTLQYKYCKNFSLKN